jgi:hypothetical protein
MSDHQFPFYELICSGNFAGVEGQRVQKLDDGLSEKVGLVNTHSRLGRIGQGVTSYVIPGDTSGIRHPIRSTEAQAVTPGGNNHGRGRVLGALTTSRIGGARQLFRCPPGFEGGGRFSNRLLSTCGVRLFNIPDASNNVGGVSQIVPNLPDANNPLSGTLIRGNPSGLSSIVSRAANVQVVGAANPNRVEAAIRDAILPISTSKLGTIHLVRRDGSVLQSVVDIPKLSKIKKNEDIKGGMFVTRIDNPATIGHKEFALLLGDANGVVFALPDGSSSLRLQKTARGLKSPDAIRGLNRKWQNIISQEQPFAYGSSLEKIVSESGGNLELIASFQDAQKAQQLIEVTRDGAGSRMVRRWIYDLFMSPQAAGLPKGSKPWQVVSDTGSAVG